MVIASASAHPVLQKPEKTHSLPNILIKPQPLAPRSSPHERLSTSQRTARPFQDSLVMKYLASGVPAYFSPIRRAKSSTELRGRWFTTRCWAFPATLR